MVSWLRPSYIIVCILGMSLPFIAHSNMELMTMFAYVSNKDAGEECNLCTNDAYAICDFQSSHSFAEDDIQLSPEARNLRDGLFAEAQQISAKANALPDLHSNHTKLCGAAQGLTSQAAGLNARAQQSCVSTAQTCANRCVNAGHRFVAIYKQRLAEGVAAPDIREKAVAATEKARFCVEELAKLSAIYQIEFTNQAQSAIGSSNCQFAATTASPEGQTAELTPTGDEPPVPSPPPEDIRADLAERNARLEGIVTDEHEFGMSSRAARELAAARAAEESFLRQQANANVPTNQQPLQQHAATGNPTPLFPDPATSHTGSPPEGPGFWSNLFSNIWSGLTWPFRSLYNFFNKYGKTDPYYARPSE